MTAMAGIFSPPPFLAINEGGATTTSIQSQVYNNGDTPHHSLPSTSTSSSVIIVIIIIASAIIVSASIYLLTRFVSRRFHRSLRTFSIADDVVPHSNNRADVLRFNNSSSPNDLLDSLPLFSFGSVTGNISCGDCAVCLSKFKPHDQLRLLPLCCHAFHAECIGAWLLSNQTCPLCRSSVHPTEADVLNKILSASAADNSFRIEIGSISRRRAPSDSGRRSYSVGSFEYIMDDGYEISMGSTPRRGVSDCASVDKDSTAPPPEPPGENLAAEVAGSGGRNWMREYVDRVSASVSSRTLSFRGSGRFFSGSSRRSEVVVPVDDIEANTIGEEISEVFRWLSGV